MAAGVARLEDECRDEHLPPRTFHGNPCHPPPGGGWRNPGGTLPGPRHSASSGKVKGDGVPRGRLILVQPHNGRGPGWDAVGGMGEPVIL